MHDYNPKDYPKGLYPPSVYCLGEYPKGKRDHATLTVLRCLSAPPLHTSASGWLWKFPPCIKPMPLPLISAHLVMAEFLSVYQLFDFKFPHMIASFPSG